jgi:site-specific recombinase XerD
MRKIIFNHLKDGDVPIPYFEGGEVHTDLLNFLLCRYHYRSLLRPRLKETTPITIKNIAHHIAYLINIFAENEDENGNMASIDYRVATFEHVSQIINHLHEEEDWTGESLKIYASSWRLFYEFLTIENVNHNMVFPERTIIKHRTDKDDDFLSHTRDNIRETSIETAVPDRFCVKRDDYRDKVISMDNWFKLYNYLYKEDVVYAVMAATMMQTFLRIGGVMQFPIGINPMNKRWERYTQMAQGDLQYQRFNYINKGQKTANCLVHITTMKMIFDEYLDTVYDSRHQLYIDKYIYKKHAIKQNRDDNMKFTWLNKNGTPVSIRELQAVFKEASEYLGFEVTPHTLRHTGATQILYRWGKENNITIMSANTTDIHSWLKYQLGHQNIRTTEMYVATVHRLQSENVMIELLASTLPHSREFFDNIKPEAHDAMQRAIANQDEYFQGRINDETLAA